MLKTFKLTYTVVKSGPQVIFTTYLPELPLFSIPKGHNSFKARTLYTKHRQSENKAADRSEAM